MATDTVLKNGAGVGFLVFFGNWAMLDVMRARYGSQILHFPLVWQKKGKNNDKEHRDCRAASLGESARGSELKLKVEAPLDCPESILTFRINGGTGRKKKCQGRHDQSQGGRAALGPETIIRDG